MKVRACLGFGEFRGKCTEKPGTKWSPYWCERCDQLRRDHITSRFEKLIEDTASKPSMLKESKLENEVP